MIRNLLYSIFLHIVILFAIYFGIETIDLQNEDLDKEKELLVSLVSLKDPQAASKPKKKEIAAKPKPKPKKKKISTIKTPSPKIRKKISQPTLNKATNINAKIKKESVEKEKITPIFDPNKIYIPDKNEKDIDSLLLSSIHKRAIKSQLNHCFTNILKNQEITKNIVKEIEVSFSMTRSGVLTFDIASNFDEKLLNLDEYYNYKKIIEKIDKNTKKCAIFRNLPKNRYNSWKNFKVLFK